MGATRYKNTTTHPVDLDDGTVIGAGEFADDPDTRGPLAKALIESGQLTRQATKPTGDAAKSRRRARNRRQREAEEATATTDDATAPDEPQTAGGVDVRYPGEEG